MANILLVEDDIDVADTLRDALMLGHHRVEIAHTADEAKRHAMTPDFVILDYGLPDGDGLSLLPVLRAKFAGTPIVFLTAQASMELAVRALREGAHHFLTKPVDVRELSRLIDDTIATHSRSLLGASSALREVELLIRRIAQSPATTVMITGESGTGKNLVASILHEQSDRRAAPFTNITCSALPETLLESELFGHERGAFTDARERKLGLLEIADGGTVFLDEIGEMSPKLQAKMLRFLEDHKFRRVGGSQDISPDVRVIAATHRDLEEACQAGTFREDLYYRLAVICIDLPALRERPDDVAPLALEFLKQFARAFDKRVTTISPEGLRSLRERHWPGNTRELRNTIERAVLLCEGTVLEASDLRPRQRKSNPPPLRLPDEGIDLENLECELLKQALERTSGNRTQAGELLGLNRDQVRYRIAKFGLE